MKVVRVCKHRWLPFTKHKAKCSKCRRAIPWVDLVATTDAMYAWLTERSKEHATRAKLRARVGYYSEAVEADAMASAYAFAALHAGRR